MKKNKKEYRSLAFYDRCGMTHHAIFGKKKSTRIILECSSNLTENQVREFAGVPEIAVGDLLPVLMSYKNLMSFNLKTSRMMCNGPRKYDYYNEIQGRGWQDKYYVESELMPFRVEVTGVRLRKLHDITDEEIAAQGLTVTKDGKGAFRDEKREYCGMQVFDSPTQAYRAFIDLSEGKGVWEANPWTLEVDFLPPESELLSSKTPI